MDLQEIDILIEADGQTRIEVRGVKGPACLALTQELEKALGGQVLHREMTPEAAELGQLQQDQWLRAKP